MRTREEIEDHIEHLNNEIACAEEEIQMLQEELDDAYQELNARNSFGEDDE